MLRKDLVTINILKFVIEFNIKSSLISKEMHAFQAYLSAPGWEFDKMGDHKKGVQN